MPLPPYNADAEEKRGSSALVKGFVTMSAIGSWGLFGLFFFTNTVPVPIAPVCFVLASVLSFVGSAVCLFGIRRETKRAELWMRWCALANYLALAAVVGVPLLQSCTSKYR